MTIALLLLLWLAVIAGFNYWDYKVTRHGGKPNYLIYFIVRGMASILHSALCLILLEDQYTDYGSLSAWQLFVLWSPYLGFQVTSFWIQYEVTRNWWTNEALLYYDQSEGDSGIVDRFFKWAGPTFHAVAKVMALAVAVLSAWLIYVRH